MPEKTLHGHGGTVLLAEGDVLVRTPVAEYLRECGYRVIEAITSSEAIAALEDARFEISVVLSSVQLAGGGFGVSRWVRKHRPELKVILTGTPKKTVDAVSSLCTDDTVPTRLAPQQLLRRIQQMLATRKPPSEAGRTAS